MQPATAAPFVDWEDPDPAYAAVVHSAGIHTYLYTFPNRVNPAGNNRIWPFLCDDAGVCNEADFAHVCGGDGGADSRVTTTFGTGCSGCYLTDPHAPGLATAWSAEVDSLFARAGGVRSDYDAVFEDGTDELFYIQDAPCSYIGQPDWDKASSTTVDDLFAKQNLPILYNGLGFLGGGGYEDWAPDGGSKWPPNGPTAKDAGRISPAFGLAKDSHVLGARMEECYVPRRAPNRVNDCGLADASAFPAVQLSWAWLANEKTEIEMAAAGKLFICMGGSGYAGDTSLGERLFMVASFLLTYDLQSSVLSEDFTTASELRVEPESALVPVDPVVPQPSDIAELLQTGGAYGREYRHCYLKGVDQGRCAVAVNGDCAGHPFPFSGYTRRLALSGAGVLDQGTASVMLSSPPSILDPGTAAIAFE